ncbi:MAG: hypothetical protein AB7I50_12555 [Vicinamibacterales bacterium]
MSVTIKLANVWRVLRDVNLDAIQASASSRFTTLIVADAIDDARHVRALLSEDAPDGHPWVIAVEATADPGSKSNPPWFAIAIARDADVSPAVRQRIATAAATGASVITVVIGPDASCRTPSPGEDERLTAPSIDSQLGRDLGAAMVRLAKPDWRLALARQLPALRPAIVTTLIDETARANASYAMASGLAEIVPVLTAPMNLGDMVILTKNQLVMGYRIALACGMEGEPRKLIPEILGVLGGGLLFRQLARQLVGLIPVFGLVPKVSIAYGGTYAIGRAVAAWASEGRELSAEALQRISQEGLDRGRELAHTLASEARRRKQAWRWRRETLRRNVAPHDRPVPPPQAES